MSPYMTKISSLLLLTTLPFPLLACELDIEPARLRGVHRVSMQDTAQLIQVRQINEDLAITVKSPAGVSLTYDSPAGRNAIEYVYLPATETGEFEICLESAFANSAPGEYEFYIEDLTGSSAQANAAYMSMNEGSRLWHQAGN